ncbi:MAG: exodeoxyribonuclease subunit beta [Rhizobacter sp.]|nr:exodeoxyribonuclease subunit beta [Rhizobacter sp.]
MSESLNALTLPLWGSRLIEASAGTGKTWTIAALYLRLVLGHGADGARYERPLTPSEILVMTFTRAATRELSDRIRSRLLEAARCFRGEQVPAEGDDLLRELMASYAGAAEFGMTASSADDGRSETDDWTEEDFEAEAEAEAEAEPAIASTALAHAAWRLSTAAESMDDAAVHTIDAWCQRMLREHAFDSGNLFDEELMADEKNMIDEAARDYWRQQLYPLQGGALDAALAVWPTVDKLIEDVRRLIEHSVPVHGEPSVLGSLVDDLMRERRENLGALKQGWAQRADEMLDWLEGHYESKSCPFNKSKLQRRHYTGWLDALKGWAAQPELHLPDMKTGMTRFTPEGMRNAIKPAATVELHPHFEAFDRLKQALDAMPDLQSTVRLHAAACVKDRLDMLKEQAGAFGFKDMLDRLDAALHGPNGGRLRQRMIEQYPVALIDEFQDTSSLQYRIFDSLYRTADNDPATAMLLIGDPKQSIYGFRGADIDSYLGARHATDDRHYVLGTNHRSTVALVGAVNRLFEQAEARPGRGAFMFRADGMGPSGRSTETSDDTRRHRQETAGDRDPLPFIPVQAKGRKEQLVDTRGPVPAMTVVHESTSSKSDASLRKFAALCAEHIVGSLADERSGYRSADPVSSLARLRPADIAVLVRTGNEARAVRRELQRRGVASVYLSDKDSVFDSDEARDLVRWLKAVASPADMRLLRSAFATGLVGLSVDELARIASDEDAFDTRNEQIRELHQVWLRQGVLTMLRQTLHALSLPSRWLSGDDGERKLTNFLHLAELLQAASTQLDGEQALVRWLGDQVDGALDAGDDRIVRLESDADLVKVVTIHKSKGLEYPIVCLPFAGSFRAANGKDRFVRVSDGEGGRRLVFDMNDEQAMEQADDERLQEDVRLLYVALTRARHALWIGVSPLAARKGDGNSLHHSAFGHLLNGGEAIDAAQLGAVLGVALGVAPPDDDVVSEMETELAPSVKQRAQPSDSNRMASLRASGSVVLQAAPAVVAATRLVARASQAPLHDAPPYDADFERYWAIGSFSALVRDLPTASVQASMREAVREEELLDEPDEPRRTLPVRTADAPWHRFPRGAFPGNFLHDQLEWLAGEDFALAGEGLAAQALRDQLSRRCERDGWGHRADDVLAWLTAVVATQLPPVGVSLDAISTRLSEMEFWFPSDGVASSRVDALCREHLLAGRARPALPMRRLRGMLMGFADLVFEHAGRYWVLDYKSNALGKRDADYHRDALEAAVAEHRYDVQAGVYLLALHRLLRARLGDAYDPAEHIGGAVFFFLRGIEGPERGCCLVPAAPALLEALDEALGSREEVA